jgi:WD40 repeat protein
VARRLAAAYNRGMSQTPDTGPPATWQREILLRGILALLMAGLMLGVNSAVNHFGSLADLAYILPPAAGFLAGLPEGLIRRSWRMGLLSSILGCAACTLGFWLTCHLKGGSLLCPLADRLAAVSLGAAWGLAAGIGVRSLAAVLAAFVLGQAGGLLGYEAFEAAGRPGILPEPLGMYVGWAALFLPLALGVGIGVWLGVKLGKGRRFRFSLRTLVIATLLAGSGMGLWWRWGPWTLAQTFRHSHAVAQVGFAPDGKSFFTLTPATDAPFNPFQPRDPVNERSILHVWGLPDGEERFAREIPELDFMARIRFLPGGAHLLTGVRGDVDDTLYSVLDARTGTELQGPSWPVMSVSFSKDGRRLLYQARGACTVLDLGSRRETQLRLPEGMELVCLHEISPDGELALVKIRHGRSEALSVFSATTGTHLTDLGSRLWDWQFSPDGKRLLLVGTPKACLCEAATGKVLVEFDAAVMRGAAFSSDGRRILLQVSESEAAIFDARTGSRLTTLTGKEVRCEKSALPSCFGRDDRIVWNNGLSHWISWDAESGRNLLCIEGENFLSNDETRLFRPANSLTGEMLDAKTGEHLCDLDYPAWNTPSLPEESGVFRFVSQCTDFSPDDRWLLVGGPDKAARLWCRRRPERWWGVAWLPEFWLTILFAGALVWSLWRDHRTL